MQRPSFAKAWALFIDLWLVVQDVGTSIGGKIKANTDFGVFQNACSVRVSYVMNYPGIPIPIKSSYATVFGGDKKTCMCRVNDLWIF